MKHTPADIQYMKAKGIGDLTGMEVEPEWHFFWQAYMHLRRGRLSPAEGGAIPFSEITNYADVFGITCPVQKYRLARMVIALDDVERTYGDT